MPEKRKRGFASMDPDLQRQISSHGGRAAHERKTAHEFNPEEAAEAGRRGGNSVSRNRQYMAEIGRKGGLAARRAKAATTPQPETEPAEPQPASESQPTSLMEIESPAPEPESPSPAADEVVWPRSTSGPELLSLEDAGPTVLLEDESSVFANPEGFK